MCLDALTKPATAHLAYIRLDYLAGAERIVERVPGAALGVVVRIVGSACVLRFEQSVLVGLSVGAFTVPA